MKVLRSSQEHSVPGATPLFLGLYGYWCGQLYLIDPLNCVTSIVFSFLLAAREHRVKIMAHIQQAHSISSQTFYYSLLVSFYFSHFSISSAVIFLVTYFYFIWIYSLLLHLKEFWNLKYSERERNREKLCIITLFYTLKNQGNVIIRGSQTVAELKLEHPPLSYERT